MTQTDPITYKAKMEEIKDGVKGAPSPSMVFYGHERFMVDPPYEEEPEDFYRLNYGAVESQEPFAESQRSFLGSEEPVKYWWEEESKSEAEPQEQESGEQGEESVAWWQES